MNDHASLTTHLNPTGSSIVASRSDTSLDHFGAGFTLAILLLGLSLMAAVMLAVALGRRRSARLAAAAALKSPELELDARLGKLRRSPIKVDGVELDVAWREAGRGPSLLCLHGIGASMLIWRRLAPLLADQFRVVCLDWPGFGDSDKPASLKYDLDQQAQALELFMEREFSKLSPPLVLASSMGGSIALHCATRRPELFRGIIAISPATDPQRIPKVLLPLSRWGKSLGGLHSMYLVKRIVNLVIARRGLITPELVALYHRPFRESPLCGAAFFKALHLLADQRMPTAFMNLPTPLLLVYGLRDALVRKDAIDELAKLNPNSRVATHADAGHHAMEDEPEWLAQQTREFLTRLT